MSYKINHYNGKLITVVADGTIDGTLDIALVGKNYAGYGAIQNDNFVYLLENFANITPPQSPIAGQVWFDSGNKKLRFFDGNKFRATGGAEIGAATPTGLTTGDLWFDTANNQLHAYTGTGFALIGPQIVSTSNITEMVPASLRDSETGEAHSIVQAMSNGETVFIYSADSEFTLDDAVNPVAGFTKVHKGITLAYTYDNSDSGVTFDETRFWGTATNAEKLGGLGPEGYVNANDPGFDSVVNFADVGFTVGKPNPKLKIYNSGAAHPTIANVWDDTITFVTTVNSVAKQPMILSGTDILPGTDNLSNIGSSTHLFNQIYATSFVGTATQSNTMRVGTSTNYVQSSTTPTSNTVAVRTSTNETIGNTNVTAGALKATYFVGTATVAQYADLAELYLADAVYEVGTVMCVGGKHEVTAAGKGTTAIGAVSEKPAYLMNKDLKGGTAVALKGRVPVKVIGPVSKGDNMYPSANGTATNVDSGVNTRIFAIALESDDGEGVRLVECLIL